MIAQLVCVLFVVGAIAANPVGDDKHGLYHGVDPNTLSCDPEGHIPLLLPHYSECNKYYHCDNGKEVERSCSSVTIFDFELQTCNWDWATKCWLRDLEIDGSGDGDGSGWEVEESVSDVHTPVVAPANFHPTLDCQQAAYASRQLPYQGDCQRFWRCHLGKIETAYCSDGLFFNAQTQMCDYEANVKCEAQMDDELQGEYIVYE